MSNPWFRMYNDTVNNPKAQSLSGDDFKLWINLLCIASQNGGFLPPISETAFRLRASVTVTEAVLQTLVTGNLFTVTKNQHQELYYPKNWEERQYKSDSSKERTRRWRDKSKTVTQTVTVTPPEQNRTEQIKKVPKKEKSVTGFSDPEQPPLPAMPDPTEAGLSAKAQAKAILEAKFDEVFENCWAIYPKFRIGGRDEAKRAFKKQVDNGVPPQVILDAIRRYAVSDEATRENGSFAKGFAAWLNGERWRNQWIPAGSSPAKSDAPKDHRHRSHALTV